MSKGKKYLRMEAEVEIFACAHITGMIFLYGFLQWLLYDGSVSFPILLEQMITGYVISWTQKGLFFREKPYKEWEYRIREILWCLLPACLTVAGGILGNWFPRKALQASLWFYGIMFIYFILLRLFLEKVYREETEEINQLLQQRRNENKKK